MTEEELTILLTEHKLECTLNNMLIRMGGNPSLDGFYYIKAGIKYIMKYGLTVSLMNVVYPQIANDYSTSRSRVERSIRNFIRKLWDRERFGEINIVFGFNGYDHKNRPTNGYFMGVLSERLSYDFAYENDVLKIIKSHSY